MAEHYFSESPSVKDERHELTVRLRGHSVNVTTASGTFSHHRLDPGTTVLLNHAAEPPADGTFVDLGCGWGAIAIALGLSAPASRVIAVDVNERALELTALNASRAGAANVEVYSPAAGLEALGDRSIDLLWSNPPIRIGKSALHDMLRTWLGKLAPTGRADLVVAKNLGSDSLQRWIGDELGLRCERTASSKGFRILTVFGADQ